MKTKKLRELEFKLDFYKNDDIFSYSMNRMKKKARHALKKAKRREEKRIGKKLIEEES